MIRLARFVAAVMTVLLAASSLSLRASDLDYLAWIDSAEAYFATPQEREAFKHVLSKPQFDAFIGEFWAKRGEAFHQEIKKRIAFADQQFAIAGRRGSETERGRVWMILGSPSTQRSDRTEVGREAGTFQFGSGTNILDQQAILARTWIYKSDRLPKALGVPELVVKFQTDMRKGYETIENPGIVEPYLTRAAQHLQDAFKAAPPSAAATKPSAGAPPSPEDPLWSAPMQLNGATFTGESYISATEKPFYAIDFYLPKSAFGDASKVMMSGLIRDPGGKEVKSVRVPSEVQTYDTEGDRFVDASFELPPGHYSGAFAIATLEGKLLASTKNEFDVIAPDSVGMSRALMTSRIDMFEKQQALDPFTFVAMKYVVKGDRRFRSSDKIAYFAAVSNPTMNPEASMTLKMKVSKDGKPFASTPLAPAALTQTGPHTYLLANQFDAGTFTPGHYTLEVQLRDMNAPKTNEAFMKGYVSNTEFEVVP